MTVATRPGAKDEFEQWNQLYESYAQFYKVVQDQPMRDTVWGWLHDADHQTCGLVAENAEGKVIGLAHYPRLARPLAAATGGFLDDLFVEPQARGSGAAAALIDALKTEGERRGWSVIRWITADDNYRARALYDKMAVRTHWLTYDIKI